MTDNKELIARLRDADLYNAQHYERDPLHKQAADRIEALEAKLAVALEKFEIIRDRQYYRMGPGITAQVIARNAIAAIKDK